MIEFLTNLWKTAPTIGTLAMVVVTAIIIWQGRQQHRDKFKPICVLVAPGGIDPLNKRGELIKKRDPSPDNPSFGILAIGCALQNVGAGPALNLRIKFKFLDMGGWTTEPWALSSLGPGEIRGGVDTPLLIPIRLHEHFNQTDLDMLTGKQWEIWVDYQDIFGRSFCAVHHKSLVQDSFGRQLQPWVTYPGEKILIDTAFSRSITWLRSGCGSGNRG